MSHCAKLTASFHLWATPVVLVPMFVPASASAQERRPVYPKVNVATAYVVDPHWPQRPASAGWDAVPGVAVDRHDHVWIFTRAVPPVQVFDANGKFIRSWGDTGLKGAHHIRFDHDGNVWLAVYARHIIQKYSPEGKLLLTIGIPDEAGRDQRHFNKPTDMAISPAGDVFIADGYGNARIVHCDKEGRYVKEWGELGQKPGQFSIPHSIVADSTGRLYVADRNNVRIQVFDQQGKVLDEWRNLVVPWGLWMTPKDELWVCGSSPMQWRPEDAALGCPPKDQVFMKFTTGGRVLQLWTVPTGPGALAKPGDCSWVHAIAADSKDNLYVGEIMGKRAQKFVRRAP